MEGLTFSAGAEDVDRVVDVELDGRRLWSIRLSVDHHLGAGGMLLDWPRVLLPYLDGHSEWRVRPVDGAGDAPSCAARLGTATGPVAVLDPHGIPLVVNKWGNLGKSLGDQDDAFVERLLDRMDQVRELLAARSDVPVFVTGGTLLGPYRDGRIMSHDDDVDLAYLSTHTHPVDVVREAFHLGRVLAADGHPVVRFSAGHIQVRYYRDGRPDGYVDLFTGWIDDDGWWHQSFALRSRARREQLLPVHDIDVNGRPEPACREPETMLEAIYGPGWATPDPAFKFDVPSSTGQRMYGWLSDQDMDRARWRDHHLYSSPATSALEREPSAFARWTADRLRSGGRLLEIGSGLGDDALWFSRLGHQVDALDFSYPAVQEAARLAEEHGLTARFHTVNLNDLRRVIAFGGSIAARGEPVDVFARGLLGSLGDVGRPQLWRLLSMVLRAGGTAYLDVPRESWSPVFDDGEPLHRALDVDVLAAEMQLYGLRTGDVQPATEPHAPTPWSPETRDLPTTRMVITWHRTHD